MRETRDFFDRNAANWDSFHRRRDFRAAEILVEKAKIGKGAAVLDAGSGTGILIPFLERTGAAITALDASPKMIEKIRSKFSAVKAVLGEFEDENLFGPGNFDRVLIYNAFPHFSNPAKAARNAFRFLREGGRFLIGHSMNREKLDSHHRKAGGAVAGHMLMPNEKMRKIFGEAGFQGFAVEENEYFWLMALNCGLPSKDGTGPSKEYRLG